VLSVVLARPARRNAVDAAMRDALVEALSIAELDSTLRVVLRGDGPCFSAGGDLDEFGSATDPAAAHLVRVQASAGAVLHRIRDRVRVRVHGACFGAGVELPAFAGHVVAAVGTTFVLPEVAMGLLPGAGGTVSIPRRIGRHRTLWLALSGAPLDASVALAWGLVDELE
jgi:enoyl-CoA hydratase/carnithine racemase